MKKAAVILQISFDKIPLEIYGYLRHFAATNKLINVCRLFFTKSDTDNVSE